MHANRNWILKALGVLGGIAMLFYPVLVYVGLTQTSVRVLATGLIVVITPVVIVRFGQLRTRREVATVSMLPLITAVLLMVAAIFNSRGWVIAVPVAINSILLLTFGATLFAGPPMIERFARLQEPMLSSDKLRWCRMWTVVWCVFFLTNAAIAAALGVYGSFDAWAVYNGLVAYVLIGMLFAVEWVLRRLRFGKSP